MLSFTGRGKLAIDLLENLLDRLGAEDRALNAQLAVETAQRDFEDLMLAFGFERGQLKSILEVLAQHADDCDVPDAGTDKGNFLDFDAKFRKLLYAGSLGFTSLDVYESYRALMKTANAMRYLNDIRAEDRPYSGSYAKTGKCRSVLDRPARLAPSDTIGNEYAEDCAELFEGAVPLYSVEPITPLRRDVTTSVNWLRFAGPILAQQIAHYDMLAQHALDGTTPHEPEFITSHYGYKPLDTDYVPVSEPLFEPDDDDVPDKRITNKMLLMSRKW